MFSYDIQNYYGINIRSFSIDRSMLQIFGELLFQISPKPNQKDLSLVNFCPRACVHIYIMISSSFLTFKC